MGNPPITRGVTSQPETAPDLRQRRILVTRPEPEASETAALIRACNGLPLLAPALIPAPPRETAPFARAMAQLEAYEGVLLTSAAGARSYLAALGQRPSPPLFTVGPKTARLLAGHPVLHPPATFNGEAMARWLLDNPALPGQRPLLYPQAEEGREELVTLLQEAGRPLQRVAAYRMEAASRLPQEVEEAWRQGQVEAVLFFSSRTARVFREWLPGPVTGWPLVAALSPVTAKTLEEMGIVVAVTPATATAESLVHALARHWARTEGPVSS